jgi:hypothetical protein
VSIRFDQLRRQIDLLLRSERRAWRAHFKGPAGPAFSIVCRALGVKERWEMPSRSEIDLEAARIMAKLRRALEPLPGAELRGEGFRPPVLDVSQCHLPPRLAPAVERWAENAHLVWARDRTALGWCWGPTLDETRRTHPNLVPWEELGGEERARERSAAEDAIKVIVMYGFRLLPPALPLDAGRWKTEPEAALAARRRGAPLVGAARAPAGKALESEPKWIPEPADTTGFHLSEEMMGLVDLLAENEHAEWAEDRLSKGWRYGPHADAKAMTHPCLVPYCFLSGTERRSHERIAAESVKLLMALGVRVERDDSDGHGS